jgi:hypothetical protein
MRDLIESSSGEFRITVDWLDSAEANFDEARRIAGVLRERHEDEGVLVKAEGNRVLCRCESV